MIAYQPEAWHDLYVAVAGAAATLTGLIFVAVSINLEKIMSSKRQPARAGEAMGVLLAVLCASICVLVPGQPRALLGIELAVLGAVLLLRTARSPSYRNRPTDAPLNWVVVPAAIGLFSSVPMVIAGISLSVGHGGGLYWMVAELVFAFGGSALNAWILLIEINR